MKQNADPREINSAGLRHFTGEKAGMGKTVGRWESRKAGRGKEKDNAGMLVQSFFLAGLGEIGESEIN